MKRNRWQKIVLLLFISLLTYACTGGIDLTGIWMTASGSSTTYNPGYGYATPTPNYGYTNPGYTNPGYTNPGYTNPGYGSTGNLTLQLQQTGTQIAGVATQNNSLVGNVMGIINGSSVNLTIQFTPGALSYGSGNVIYTGMVYPDGTRMVLTPNISSTGGASTPLTFIRSR